MASDLEGSSERDGGAVLSDGSLGAAPFQQQPSSPDSLASPPHLLAPDYLAPDAQPASHAQPPGAAEGATEPLLRSPPASLSTLIPLAEAADAADLDVDEPDPLLGMSYDEEEHDDSSCGMDSSARGDQDKVDAGYESSDDMDFLSARHCINCTGDMWGSVCRACGYMDGHEASIFDPVVAPPLRTSTLGGSGSTMISFDDRMLLHDENLLPLHPERADRIRAVMARLNAAQLTGRCRRLPSREATPQEVERCHIPELMNAINILSERSKLQGNKTLHWPTSDTYVNQHTALCARLSAGACADVAVAVARGEAANGVAIVRPPGHHAESNTAMGFCFFNNAGIAARAAQDAGAGRVIILDFDIHHGNGTQHIFEADPSVMYMSLHRHDGGQFYPGTGAATEVGAPGAEGTTVNVPWPCGGMRNGDYMAAFQHLIMPIAHEFAPDLVIISAGFDAAEGDPIGGCLLTPEVYAHMTAMLQTVAPTVLLLEGGYNLLSVAKSTEACVRVLLGERPPPLPAHQHACEAGMGAVALAMRVQARYWRSVRGLLARLLPAAGPAGVGPLQQQQSGRLLEEEADEDTDTPHMPHGHGDREFASGSGWESDLDPHSGASLGEDDSREGHAHADGHHAAAAAQQEHPDTSDTDLETEQSLGAEGEEEEEEGFGQGEMTPPQRAGSGQLQMSPQQPQPFNAAALDTASPDLLPLQEPACSGGSAGAGGLASAALMGGGCWNVAAGGKEGAAAHNWRKLALKVVAMKRASQKAPRLSPQLLRQALADPGQPSFKQPSP